MTQTQPARLSAGLNDAQRRAVEHGADGCSGPLIVLAGPGTGKTRVIIHRIARLIGDGAAPESILAVTFTNKAAAQLRERLAEIVGSAKAGRVRAQTFHALGLSLVRRFASDLGIPPVRPDVAILDSAQRIRLMREAIVSQNLFADRRASGLDALAAIVQSSMNALGERAIEPAECMSFVEVWRKRIECGQNSAGQEVDSAELKAESVRLEEFGQIALAYQWIESELRRRGWLGFEDLVMLPIRLLRTSPRAAAVIHAEFRHALVDEFQDVNAGQIQLLHRMFPTRPADTLSGEPSGPDLCIVGDDDQAIYGFRGSDDRAFARFDALWPGSRRILLTENYRSQPPIIAAANRIISLAEHRFAPDKQVARALFLEDRPPQPGEGVECIHLGTEFDDGPAIASAILLDRAAGPEPGRPWDQYAVVCRNNRDITRIVADLELEGIPARGSHGEALCEDQGVQDVLAWMTLLVNPREVWPIQRILTRAPLAADPLAVMEYHKQYRSSRRMAETGDPDPAFLDWLVSESANDVKVAAAVRRLAELHRKLMAVTASAPAPEAIEQIIILTDAAHADLLPARGRARRINALLALVRLARLSQPKLDQPRDLREFWRYWQDLDDRDRSLRDIGGLDELVGPNDLDAADESQTPAVTVISAHKAKGLEWDTVFVPRVSPSNGYGKAGSADPLPVPAGLLGDETDADERQHAEERRIFYVACTRAERRLVLLAKKNKNPSKSVHFFEEFTRDPAGQSLVTVCELAELRARAAAALGRDDLLAAADSSHGQLAAEPVDRARLAVRLAAAEALEFADRPDIDLSTIEAASDRLRTAATRLAVVAHVAERRALPKWIRRDAALTAYATNLLALLTRDDQPVREAPRPPLNLSFTAIDAYVRCPRCYWLRFVKGLPEAQRRQTVLGTVVHKALERFYSAVREAEAAGREPPTIETLLRLGRTEFNSAWPQGIDINPYELDQALAQLTVAHTRLHDSRSQVLEIEKNVYWEYTLPAEPGISPETVHNFSAKLDRIDQITLPDGRAGFRIVDYKTGKPWKKLTEPPADDLQMGIYALALPHLLPDVDPADIVAEYWLLASGERGVLPVASLRLDKVENQIRRAARGILAGKFDPADSCEGDCRILRTAFGSEITYKNSLFE